MTEISQYFFPCAEFSVLPFVLYEEKVVAYQEPAPKNPFYVPWRRLFSSVATNVNGPNTTAKKDKALRYNASLYNGKLLSGYLF